MKRKAHLRSTQPANEEAMQGQIDPLIGRLDEVERWRKSWLDAVKQSLLVVSRE